MRELPAEPERLSESERQEFKQKLVATREQIDARRQATWRQARQAEEPRGDSLDKTVDEQLRDNEFRLRAHDAEQVRQIEEALERIEQGDYGVCSLCEEPIALPRLRANPTATRCVDCQESHEHQAARAKIRKTVFDEI